MEATPSAKTYRVFLLKATSSGRSVTLYRDQLNAFIDFCEKNGITYVFNTRSANATLYLRIIDALFGTQTSIQYYGQHTVTVSNIPKEPWYDIVFRDHVILAITEENGFLKAGVFRPVTQKIIAMAMQNGIKQ